MRPHLAAFIMVAISSLCLGARPTDAQEPSAAGLWQQIDPETSKSEGWFLIFEHSGAYDGAIVRMFLKPGDPPNPPLCTQCKGDQLNAPWLGLTIIKGMVRKGLDYDGGTILDPRNGSEWNAKMTLSPDGQDIIVRGYLLVPLAGMNQSWKRLADACSGQLDPAVITKFKLTTAKPGAPLPKGTKPAAAGC